MTPDITRAAIEEIDTLDTVKKTNSPASPTLTRLGDHGLTIADRDADVRGRRVVDKEGKDIGKVADLLIDLETRQVRLLQVDHGGILGFGARSSFVPVDAVTRITDDTVHVDQTGRRVAGAPAYRPEIGVDNDYYQSISGYYGYMPSWNPEYLYPRYPLFGQHAESIPDHAAEEAD